MIKRFLELLFFLFFSKNLCFSIFNNLMENPPISQKKNTKQTPWYKSKFSTIRCSPSFIYLTNFNNFKIYYYLLKKKDDDKFNDFVNLLYKEKFNDEDINLLNQKLWPKKYLFFLQDNSMSSCFPIGKTWYFQINNSNFFLDIGFCIEFLKYGYCFRYSKFRKNELFNNEIKFTTLKGLFKKIKREKKDNKYLYSEGEDFNINEIENFVKSLYIIKNDENIDNNANENNNVNDNVNNDIKYNTFNGEIEYNNLFKKFEKAKNKKINEIKKYLNNENEIQCKNYSDFYEKLKNINNNDIGEEKDKKTIAELKNDILSIYYEEYLNYINMKYWNEKLKTIRIKTLNLGPQIGINYFSNKIDPMFGWFISLSVCFGIQFFYLIGGVNIGGNDYNGNSFAFIKKFINDGNFKSLFYPFFSLRFESGFYFLSIFIEFKTFSFSKNIKDIFEQNKDIKIDSNMNVNEDCPLAIFYKDEKENNVFNEEKDKKLYGKFEIEDKFLWIFRKINFGISLKI